MILNPVLVGSLQQLRVITGQLIGRIHPPSLTLVRRSFMAVRSQRTTFSQPKSGKRRRFFAYKSSIAELAPFENSPRPSPPCCLQILGAHPKHSRRARRPPPPHCAVIKFLLQG